MHNLMVFTANIAPLFRILVLSMSFLLNSDMQSDKNNNEVSNDGIAIIVNRDMSAEEAVLASGSGLRGPEVKSWDDGGITSPTYPRRPVTLVSSSSSVSVASRAHLGTNAGTEVVVLGRGGIHSDANRSGDKELSFGYEYDCANPATFSQKPSSIDSGSHHNEIDSEYHPHRRPGEPDWADHTFSSQTGGSRDVGPCREDAQNLTI